MINASNRPRSLIALTARFIRLLLLSLISAAMVLATAYVIENWRGEHAWRRLVAEHKQNGDPIYWEPAPAADAGSTSDALTTDALPTLPIPRRDPPPAAKRDRNAWREAASRPFGRLPNGRIDLEAWQELFLETPGFPKPEHAGSPASDVLVALSRWDRQLSSMNAAVRSPNFRISHQFNASGQVFSRDLYSIHSASKVLRLRATAKLAVGKADSAFEDLELVERLASAKADFASYFTETISADAMTDVLHAFWEGQIDHAWNEPQLKQLQMMFARRNPRRMALEALKAERYISILGLERLLGEAGQFWKIRQEWPDFSDRTRQWLTVFTGPGWIRQNEVNLVRQYAAAEAYGAQWAAGQDSETWKTSAGFDLFHHGQKDGPLAYTYLTEWFQPEWTPRTAIQADKLAVASRMGVIACALERYRISHGKYPPALTDLAPAFVESLPLDPCGGGDFAYSPLGDGTYSLFSDGPDRPEDEHRSEDGWGWPRPKTEKGVHKMF